MQGIPEKGARATGTAFVSFFTPDEILALVLKQHAESNPF
jgi:hypothetical protein